MSERLLNLDLIKENVSESLKREGLKPVNTHFIPEGNSHFNFEVTFEDRKQAIARFEKPHRISALDGTRRDFHFNGPLSLEREANLMALIKKEAGLSAPNVYGLFSSNIGRFLLVEKLPGVYWSDFIENNNFTKQAFLKSLKLLGKDLAQVHSIHFESFGDVISKDLVSPGNIRSFVKRIEEFTNLKLLRAKETHSLNFDEFEEVSRYLENLILELKAESQENEKQPVLILTDIHPKNLLVDNFGKPSGYFDLEFCQSGLPALEFYQTKTVLLSYFENTFEDAQRALLEGYSRNGGVYDPDLPFNIQLEFILGVGYLLSATTSYYGVKDGLRYSWSGEFKKILFESIRSGSVDYLASSSIYRNKTKQPLNAY